MAVREILKMGDPRLLRVAPPVTGFGSPELHALVADLLDTMEAANGAGLAAPQIGVDLQVVIFGFARNDRYPDAPPVPRTVLVNPVITPLTEEKAEDWEGCLSIPDIRGRVPRFTHIRIDALDRKGKPFQMELRNFPARVVQHETDHLDGVLFFDRMEKFDSLTFLEEFTRYHRGSDADEEEA